VLSAEEESAYFECAGRNQNLYDVSPLMILQGCRPDEVMSLEQRGIDLKGGRLTILGGKSRAARRTLALCGESIEILADGLRGQASGFSQATESRGVHLTKLNNSHDEVCREAACLRAL